MKNCKDDGALWYLKKAIPANLDSVLLKPWCWEQWQKLWGSRSGFCVRKKRMFWFRYAVWYNALLGSGSFLHTGKVYPEAAQTAWVSVDQHLSSADHFSARDGKTRGQVPLRDTVYSLEYSLCNSTLETLWWNLFSIMWACISHMCWNSRRYPHIMEQSMLRHSRWRMQP